MKSSAAADHELWAFARQYIDLLGDQAAEYVFQMIVAEQDQAMAAVWKGVALRIEELTAAPGARDAVH